MSLISLEDQTAVVAEGGEELTPEEGSAPPQRAAALAPQAVDGDASPPAARQPSPERQEAVAAIRTRAQQEETSESQAYPNVFETPSLGDTAPKSTDEVQKIAETVEAKAVAAEKSVDEDDPSAYEDRSKWLWGLGATHVDSTEAEIEAGGN